MALRPYAAAHQGPGDSRPTALQIVIDCGAVNKLRGKNILITGCSSGLGVETARALYETGANLFLTARDMPKLHKVIEDIISKAKSSADTRSQPKAIELHLDSLQSVRQAGQEILTVTSGKLDILILNGGVMAGALRYTQDGFENQFGTNHLAGFLLFDLLQPALLKAAHSSGEASRVVVVSSSGHAWSPVHFRDLNWKEFPMTYNQWAAYGSSKTANIYMASAIDRRFRPLIRAWSVHPGGINTGLGRNLQEDDFAGFGDVAAIFATYKSPEQGAATTVWATVDSRVDSIGGHYLADCGATLPRQAGDIASAGGYADYVYDRKAEEKLWAVSRELLGMDQET